MEAMDVDQTVDVYGDWHRQFMQVLLSRPALTSEEIQALVVKICGQDSFHGENAQQRLKTFLKTVKEKVQPLGLDLRKGCSELNGRQMYALINTSAGDETAAKKETPQLRFLRAILEEVVTSVRGDISHMAALNVADRCDGITKADAQTLLAQLARDCWLEVTDGRVALHTRCILELEPYLVQHYGQYVPRCPTCSKITVRGQHCDREGCDTKYHRYCLKKMRHRLGAAKCESCGTVIPDEER